MKTYHSRLKNWKKGEPFMATLQVIVWFKAIKILKKNHFCEYILDYEEEKEDLFHDVSQEVNNSVQSSYWETLSADYFLRWLDCYKLFSCCKHNVMLWELNFEILEQMISTKNRHALNLVGFFFGLIMFLNLKMGY